MRGNDQRHITFQPPASCHGRLSLYACGRVQMMRGEIASAVRFLMRRSASSLRQWACSAQLSAPVLSYSRACCGLRTWTVLATEVSLRL